MVARPVTANVNFDARDIAEKVRAQLDTDVQQSMVTDNV